MENDQLKPGDRVEAWDDPAGLRQTGRLISHNPGAEWPFIIHLDNSGAVPFKSAQLIPACPFVAGEMVDVNNFPDAQLNRRKFIRFENGKYVCERENEPGKEFEWAFCYKAKPWQPESGKPVLYWDNAAKTMYLGIYGAPVGETCWDDYARVPDSFDARNPQHFTVAHWANSLEIWNP